MHERVLSGEVNLRYVHVDRQVADIFTKALGLDKLQHFSEMLGLQHLDMLHRGRMDMDKKPDRGRPIERNNNHKDEPQLAEQQRGRTNESETANSDNVSDSDELNPKDSE